MNLKALLEQNNILLAPMAGVTDLPFRVICKELGCSLTYTEMVSAKGLHYNSKNTGELLRVGERETPAAVQIFGSDAGIMAEQAEILAGDERFCVIDINMGCPTPKITGNGDGSALMKDPQKAERIVRMVCGRVKKPVTVKMRKGWDESSVNAVEFAARMEGAGASMITLHGRTRAQQYSGKADWEIIARVKQAVRVPVIGNGDVFCAQDALLMLERTGCDGVMVARGALGNPWIFEQIAAHRAGRTVAMPTMERRVRMALRHARELAGIKGTRAVVEMRKHVAWYLRGGRDSARVRAAANRACSLEELNEVLNEYLEVLSTAEI